MCIHKLLYPFVILCVSSCTGFGNIFKPKYDPKRKIEPAIENYSSYVPRYTYDPKPKYSGTSYPISSIIDINSANNSKQLQDPKKIVQAIEQEVIGAKRYYIILGMAYKEYYAIRTIELIDTIEQKYKERVACVGKEKTTSGCSMQHILDEAYLALILDAISTITDDYQLLGVDYQTTLTNLDQAYGKRKKQLALVMGAGYNKGLQEALSKLYNAYKNIKSHLIFLEIKQELYGSKRYHRILGMSDAEYISIKRQPINFIDTIEQKYKAKVACFDKATTRCWHLTMDILGMSYLSLILDVILNITDDHQLLGIDCNVTLDDLNQAYTKRIKQLYLSSIPNDILPKQRTQGYSKLYSAYKRIKNNLPESHQPNYKYTKKSEQQKLNEIIDSCTSLSPEKKAIFKRINNANNIYEMLNVPTGATSKQIKKTYKDIVLLCHPDKNKDHKDIATVITQKINSFYKN